MSKENNMNSLDKLILSVMMLKSAGFSSMAFRAAQQAAKQTAKQTGKAIKKQPATKTAPPPKMAPKPRTAPKSPTKPSAAATPAAATPAAATPAAAPVSPSSLPPPSFTTPTATPALAAVAPAVAAPASQSGLALASGGLRDVRTGLGQAASAGYNTIKNRATAGVSAAKNRATAGVSAAREGLSTAARNPLVQAGAVGLGAGALGGAGGAYLMNRSSPAASGNPYQAVAADSASGNSAAPAVSPASVSYSDPSEDAMLDAENLGASPAQAANPYQSAMPSEDAMLDAENLETTAPDVDYNLAFNKYMGSYNPNSAKDQAKMQYLRSLTDRGLDLNAANVYNTNYGYGSF